MKIMEARHCRDISRIRVIGYGLFAGLCISILIGCSGAKDLMEGQTDTALFDQGKLYYAEGEYKKALEYFLYVKEHFPRTSYRGTTRFYAGECYFALEKYEDAVIEYESFLAFFPNDPDAPAAQYKLGVSYLKQSRGPDRDQTTIHKSLTELQKVRENYPDAEAYIKKAEEQVRETRHELARNEFLIGMFYRKEKLYKSSNLRFDYLIKEYPESELIGDALFHKGLNYLDLDQPEDAKASFLQLIQKYPQNQYLSKAREQLAKLRVTNIP
jgi:outer membrane protein assembly factor BamD